MATGFRFSARSLGHLNGVHPDLVRVMTRALTEFTEIDFAVIEGLRTPQEQQELVKTGASRTLKSRHLTGHAVDVMAYVGGKGRWDFGLYVKIAEAVRAAARELGVRVIWGGCWQQLNQVEDIGAAVAAYSARKKKAGQTPLIDGPHFELAT